MTMTMIMILVNEVYRVFVFLNVGCLFTWDNFWHYTRKKKRRGGEKWSNKKNVVIRDKVKYLNAKHIKSGYLKNRK